MTKLVILSPSEKERFDSPPKFNADERTIYFALNTGLPSYNPIALWTTQAYNEGEFQQGDPRNQKTAAACTALVQNALVLWNALYLSQPSSNSSNTNQQRQIVESIKPGSVITWPRVNLQGEYAVTQYAANDRPFDLTKVLALQIG